MKKVLSLLAVLLVGLLTITAANKGAATRKILDQAAQKVNLTKGASANFTIKGGSWGACSGTLAVKGKKFQATTPGAIIWYDGKTQWVYNKKSEEVNVSTPSAAQQQSMNPYTFLTLYKNGYNMSHSTSASGYEVHLTRTGGNGIPELYVLVSKDYTIKQIRLKQNGKWITININSLKQASFSDSKFKFSAKDYPKAELIDLR